MPRNFLMRVLLAFGLCIAVVNSGATVGQEASTKLKPAQKIATAVISSGKFDRKNAVIKTTIILDANDLRDVVLVDRDGNRIFGQVSKSNALAITKPRQKLLTFVLPELKAEQYRRYDIYPVNAERDVPFKWHDDVSTQSELQFDGKGVLRYMYEALDDATEQRRQETYKTYHHVFSPDGSELLTKGPGGRFPHHRGIFYGFNRITYDDQKADTWHCGDGASQRQAADPVNSSGYVFGRDVNAISWHGRDGAPFAHELRQLTAFKIDGNTLIEFESLLQSTGPKIQLDGDPQHAGVQFRASQRVDDESKAKTIYIRPDGVGRLAGFRNWSDKPDETRPNKNHINLPFNTMCFSIGDKRYSCCYVDDPKNPKPARFSERDYGRFGSYFTYELTKANPLHVRYRFWIQEGEMTVDQCERLVLDVSNPVKVEVERN